MNGRIFTPLFAALAVGLLAGCSTTQKKPAASAQTVSEKEIRRLEVAGAKLGDSKFVLRKFPAAKKIPVGSGDREVYEVYKPNTQISMLVLTFTDGRLRKMELRYFNGPTENTLASAGGWDGLRDYLIKRFGKPTRVGYGVPQLTDLRTLKAEYSRFNGEWDFKTAQRRIHYIALADQRGGVGVITFLDTSPRQRAPIIPTQQAAGGNTPNPGF